MGLTKELEVTFFTPVSPPKPLQNPCFRIESLRPQVVKPFGSSFYTLMAFPRSNMPKSPQVKILHLGVSIGCQSRDLSFLHLGQTSGLESLKTRCLGPTSDSRYSYLLMVYVVGGSQGMVMITQGTPCTSRAAVHNKICAMPRHQTRQHGLHHGLCQPQRAPADTIIGVWIHDRV